MPNNDTPQLIAKLEFKKKPEDKTSYVLVKTSGFVPGNILGPIEDCAGEGLTVEENWSKKSGFKHSIYTRNEKAVAAKCQRRPNLRGSIKARISGFNFYLDFPGRSYGDYCGDALLIEFSPDWEKFTIWIFKNARVYAAALFNWWTAGGRLDVLEAKKWGGCR